jgi:hypothetical protein
LQIDLELGSSTKKGVCDMNATLPVEIATGISLDAQKARKFGEQLAAMYSSAVPYPHIVIDDFLPSVLADLILDNFPVAPLDGDINFKGGVFEHNKRQILPYKCNEIVKNIFLFFNSAPFLEFLEGVTAIEGLIPDPYFYGGGFHEISKGGKIGIHADYRIQAQLHVNRRINVVIYLNKNWSKAYGGELELWDRAMTQKVRSIEPLFNRCIVFNTDSDSYHGHPEPLNTPDHITRKSLALFYYTASRAIYDETPFVSTVYRARPEDDVATQLAASKPSKRKNLSLKQWMPPILYRKLRAVK